MLSLELFECHKSIFGLCKINILHKVESTFVLYYALQVQINYYLFGMLSTKKVLIY